jgi:hypothetical protein
MEHTVHTSKGPVRFHSVGDPIVEIPASVIETYTVEVRKSGEWAPWIVGMSAETADFYAGIAYRSSDAWPRTVRDSDGTITHGRVTR